MVDFRAALWSFETTRFRVEFHAEPEDIDPADSFEFEADIAFARENDPAHWFCAAVYVRDLETGNIIGREYLCGCSYPSFREFYTSHRDRDPMNRNTLAMKARNTCYLPTISPTWCAVREGYDGADIEPGVPSRCPIGRGSTEQEAIADLLAIEADRAS